MPIREYMHAYSHTTNFVWSCSVSDEIKSYRFGARLASRVVHPFVNAHDALIFGQHYADASAELSDSDDESDSDLGSDSEGAADKRKARYASGLSVLDYT